MSKIDIAVLVLSVTFVLAAIVFSLIVCFAIGGTSGL